ncbi:MULTISPECIES: hypothetical protein [unclassified Streptomyces]|uniref:hypothetical protein n=1 Tax=unclassified Streptomyces TaxID=2593676 RepID=UPI003659ECC6
MHAQRAKRLFAISAAGLLMAGGAAIGTAGTASAATPSHSVSYLTGGGCGGDSDHGGWYNSGWDDDDDDWGGHGGHGHGHGDY